MRLMTWKVVRSGALIAWLGSLVASCYAADKAEVKDGQSHWLDRCSSEAECGTDEICACGVCTIACEASDACGTGASCEPVAQRACDDAPAVLNVCLVRCSNDEPCQASGLECIDHACALVGTGNPGVDPPADDSGLPPDDSGSSPIDQTERSPLDDSERSPGNVAMEPKLRVAVLWTPQGLQDGIPLFEPSGLCPEGSAGDYGGQVAQPIDMEVSLPLFVDISTLAPPPPEALVPAGGDHAGGWTVGHLVLYRDGNDNGLLDPRNLEDDSPDEVLGTSGDWGLLFGLTPNTISYVIYYSEERLPEYGPTIEAGYNLFSDDSSGLGDRVAVPLDTPIPVPVRDIPMVQALNCEEICMGRDETVSCTGNVTDAPDYGEWECYGGSSLWSNTHCEGCYCFTAACSYNQGCPGD